MSKYLEKIGLNAKIAFENKISNKKKNKVLNYYAQLFKLCVYGLALNADNNSESIRLLLLF